LNYLANQRYRAATSVAVVDLVPDRVLKSVNVTAETTVTAAPEKLLTLLAELSWVGGI